jgi:hypothetical protein
MSHFSFTRNLYDNCELQTLEKESAGPGEYAIDVLTTEPKNACYIGTSPFQHNPFFSIPQQNVDIESDLNGRSRNLSRCPDQKYNPQRDKKEVPYTLRDCLEQKLVPEYTRVKRPCNVLSGVSINRFEPLCEDVQQLHTIQNNTYIGSNTRLFVKDAFKAREKKNVVTDLTIDTNTPCNGCAYVNFYSSA